MNFKKLRLWAVYPLAILYLILAYKYGMSFRIGIWFILAGMGIRFWAAGYIQKIRKLTTSGPYSFTRNPLYVGNFLMGLGFCVFVNNIILSLIYTALFIFFYAGTVKKEEILLEGLFGKDYVEYKQSVPAFIPNFKIYKPKENVRFSLKQAHYNGELIRVEVTVILLSLLYLARDFWARLLNKNDLLRVGIFVGAQALILLLIIEDRKSLLKKEDHS